MAKKLFLIPLLIFCFISKIQAADYVEEEVVFGSDGDVGTENVVEIDVDEASYLRIKDAVAAGNVFEEDGVIVVQGQKEAKVLQIDDKGDEIEDSFVILPEKSAENDRVFDNSMRAVVSDDVSDSVLKKILPGIKKAAVEVFYFMLPYAAKVGAVMEDVSDELARKFLGMKPKNPRERAELHKRYDPYVQAGSKRSRMRRMMVEFTEIIEDEAESAAERRKRNLSRRKTAWRDDFAAAYNDSDVAVVNVKEKVVYRGSGSWRHHRRPHFFRKGIRHPPHHYRHQRRHRVHYLPSRKPVQQSHGINKPIVFRNYKTPKKSGKKYSPKVAKTKIKMRRPGRKKSSSSMVRRAKPVRSRR